MSQQSKPNNNNKEEDEVWQSLFGEGHNKAAKGQHSLVLRKDRKRKGAPIRKPKEQIKKPRIHHTQQQQTQPQQHTSSHHQTSDVRSVGERLQQFLATPRYRARLPAPPLECKFLKYPHLKNRFIKYCATNLELNYNWDIHHDSLFPLPLDLMDPDYYNPLKKNPSDDDEDYYDEPQSRVEDENILALLQEREDKKHAADEQEMPEQAFLLQTQYLTAGIEMEVSSAAKDKYFPSEYPSSDYDGNNNKRHSPKRHPTDYSRRDTRNRNPHLLENVKQSFNDAQNIKIHPRKKVAAAKIFDIFPQDKLLDLQFTHVQFGNDPAIHTKKLPFMPQYQLEREKESRLSANNSLLKCTNKEKLEDERRELNDEDDEDEDDDDLMQKKKRNRNKKNDPDWFSLYAPDMMKMNKNKNNNHDNRNSDDDDYDDDEDDDDIEITKYDWTAEYVAQNMEKKGMYFLCIPKNLSSQNVQQDEVFYARFHNRLKLRYKQTNDASSAQTPGKKGLSEQDRKFFNKQPIAVKVKMPKHHQD